MSVISIEREQYRFPANGTGALNPEPVLKAQLRIVPDSKSEFIPISKIVSISEFRERKNREAVMQTPIIPAVEITKPLPTISKKVEIENELLGEFGFDVDKEVMGLHDKFVQGLAKGLSPAEAKKKPIDETMTNSEDVHGEYALGLPILPQRILSKGEDFYNSKSGYKIVDMITEKERLGGVKEGWIRGGKLFANAKPGDTLIIISPPGQTGLYHSETGEEHEYEDMQLYAAVIGKDGVLRGVTYIVSNIKYQQVVALYSQFQAPNEKMINMKLPELNRVSEMVQQPIFLTGGRMDHYKILDTVQAAVGGRKVMRSYDGKEKTFTEARELLGKLDHLEFLPEKCKPDLDKLREYLNGQVENIQDPKVYEAIRQRIRWTYLRVAEKILGFDKKKTEIQVQAETKAYDKAMDTSNVSSFDNKFLNVMFAKTQAALALIPGCLGNKKAGSSIGLTGQTVGDLLSSNIISFPGSGGLSINGEGAKCSTCTLELCEGRCPNCEKNSKKQEEAQQEEEYKKAA